MKSWISDVRDSSSGLTSDCCSRKFPVSSSGTKHHGATTSNPSIEGSSPWVKTYVGATKTNGGTSEDSKSHDDEKSGSRSITSIRRHSGKNALRKDGPTSCIPSPMALKDHRPVEEGEDNKMAQEPYTSCPTDSLLGRIEEHMVLDQDQHEPEEVPNDRTSTTMDWSCENETSCQISGQKSNTSPIQEHKYLKAKGLRAVAECYRERGGKGDSKDEANMEKLNPPKNHKDAKSEETQKVGVSLEAADKNLAMDWSTNCRDGSALESVLCGSTIDRRSKPNKGDVPLADRPRDWNNHRELECRRNANDRIPAGDSNDLKKLRTNTLHDYYKSTGKTVVSSFDPRKKARRFKISAKPEEAHIDGRNVSCPIPGCRNQGGKGFRRQGVTKHIMGQHSDNLKKTSGNYDLLCTWLDTFDWKVCANCNKITKRCTAEGSCDKCDVKRPDAHKVVQDLTAGQREMSMVELISIQETKFVLRRAVPRKLRTLWSDIMTDIALKMSDATKESEARGALKRYLMLKAVLIKPLRGGGGRYNRNVNLAERLMTSFWKGKEEEVWETALEIEKGRQKKNELQRTRNRKRNLRGDRIRKTAKLSEVQRRSEKAKLLTNDGELRKAFATMVQRGVAPPTVTIVEQLKSKFPARKNTVRWPDKNRIDSLRSLVENTVVQMEVDECCQEKESFEESSGLRESLLELQKSIENDFQAVEVHWEDIVKVASRAKKSTGGGLCQLTPWHLKSAVLNSSGNKCAKMLAIWANRWSRGDFDTSLGAILAMSRLIPIYKDWETNDVRPVASGSAVRRLLGRALAEKIRKRVEGLTCDHQLGLKQAGYEIGIHSARHLAKQCRLSGWVILLLDFENAFNLVDRSLLLDLVIALVPEAANVFWWLYEKETVLMTHGGDKVTCATGVMQGCPFASIAFALVIKWLVSQLKHSGLYEKLFFMDDGLLCGTPMALKWCLHLIQRLEPISGLKLKFKKMSAYAPNEVSARRCKQLLPSEVEVHEDEEMSFISKNSDWER